MIHDKIADSAPNGEKSQLLRRLFRGLGRKSIEVAAPPSTPEIISPKYSDIQLSASDLHRARDGDFESLEELVGSHIPPEYTDEDLVFRAFSHPKGNITSHLVTKYGTDRFVGYDSTRLPVRDIDLIPFKNTGSSAALTADTYAVPKLNWALSFAGLASQEFEDNEVDSFLVIYDKNHLDVVRTPEGGGEQWRGVFKGEPSEALIKIIRFMPPLENADIKHNFDL